MKARIRIKRVYDEPGKEDGRRILVDRLWPRGLTKEKAKIDYWAKDIAPSNDLRKWYGHDPAKWNEFRKRYFAELKQNAESVKALTRGHGQGPGELRLQLHGANDQQRRGPETLPGKKNVKRDFPEGPGRLTGGAAGGRGP